MGDRAVDLQADTKLRPQEDWKCDGHMGIEGDICVLAPQKTDLITHVKNSKWSALPSAD